MKNDQLNTHDYVHKKLYGQIETLVDQGFLMPQIKEILSNQIEAEAESMAKDIYKELVDQRVKTIELRELVSSMETNKNYFIELYIKEYLEEHKDEIEKFKHQLEQLESEDQKNDLRIEELNRNHKHRPYVPVYDNLKGMRLIKSGVVGLIIAGECYYSADCFSSNESHSYLFGLAVALWLVIFGHLGAKGLVLRKKANEKAWFETHSLLFVMSAACLLFTIGYTASLRFAETGIAPIAMISMFCMAHIGLEYYFQNLTEPVKNAAEKKERNNKRQQFKTTRQNLKAKIQDFKDQWNEKAEARYIKELRETKKEHSKSLLLEAELQQSYDKQLGRNIKFLNTQFKLTKPENNEDHETD